MRRCHCTCTATALQQQILSVLHCVQLLLRLLRSNVSTCPPMQVSIPYYCFASRQVNTSMLKSSLANDNAIKVLSSATGRAARSSRLTIRGSLPGLTISLTDAPSGSEVSLCSSNIAAVLYEDQTSRWGCQPSQLIDVAAHSLQVRASRRGEYLLPHNAMLSDLSHAFPDTGLGVIPCIMHTSHDLGFM